MGLLYGTRFLTHGLKNASLRYYVNIILISFSLTILKNGNLEIKIQNQKAKNNGKFFEDRLIKDWCNQLIGALYYIHQNKILHNDIKPS